MGCSLKIYFFRDSSEEEPPKIEKVKTESEEKKVKKDVKTTKKPKKCWWRKDKLYDLKESQDLLEEDSDIDIPELFISSKIKQTEHDKKETPSDVSDIELTDEESKKPDSDYYSTDTSTDYSYSYQDDKTKYSTEQPQVPVQFRDVEKQDIPDYASMESYRDEQEYEGEMMTKGTSISALDQSKPERHVDFIGVPSSSEEETKVRPKLLKKKKSVCKKITHDTDVESDEDIKEESPLIGVLSSIEAVLAEKEQAQRTKLPFMDPAFCFCSESEEELKVIKPPTDDSSLFSLRPQSTTGVNTLNTCEEMQKLHLQDVPTLSQLCVSKKSSDRFSHVRYEEIDESPRSNSSSNNLTSSSLISILSDYNSEECLIRPGLRRTIRKQPRVDCAEMQYDTFPARREIELKQRNKIREYYKAVKSIPTRKIRSFSSPSKIRAMVEKVLLKVSVVCI